MHRFGDFFKLLCKLGSFLDQIRTVLNKLFIPYIKRPEKFFVKGYLFEQIVALRENLVVRREIVHVKPVDLTSFHVEEPPAFGRSCFYHRKIIRAKRDDPQKPK